MRVMLKRGGGGSGGRGRTPSFIGFANEAFRGYPLVIENISLQIFEILTNLRRENRLQQAHECMYKKPHPQYEKGR